MFVGIIPVKPSRDFTRLLGMPRGLKDLLYMLNEIASSTKEDLCYYFHVNFCFVLFC
jgi:hypothetical protein